MSETYKPDRVWSWKPDSSGKFASINRPSSGSTHEAKLPRGQHPFQLYSLATPNGVKVTILFEELLQLGFKEAEYDAWPISILEGDQFGSEFVSINPNSKIPALLDCSSEKTIPIFESGHILLHLAEKFKTFIPKSLGQRSETLNWLFWQMGSAPYLGGGFGHFYQYAPEKLQYPIDRFTLEVKRQLDLLNKKLEATAYIAGPEYTIADMAIWPWYGGLFCSNLYEASEFLDLKAYPSLAAWAKKIQARSAVVKGCRVNRTWGDNPLPERHSDSDFL